MATTAKRNSLKDDAQAKVILERKPTAKKATAKPKASGKKKPHVNPPVQAMQAGLEISRPYRLNIKNSSFTLIEKFSINRLAQALGVGKGYDGRVEVTTEPGSMMGYVEFLRWCDAHIITIGKIRITGKHDYERYNQIQLGKTLIINLSNPNGSRFSSPITPYVQLKQVVMDARECSCNFEMKPGWDIQFDLMPEAEISLYLYPASIVSQGVEQKFAAPHIAE